MTSIITRSLLSKAFPGNPRLVAEFQGVADFLDSVSDRQTLLTALLAGLQQDLGEGGKFQAAASLLNAIAELPNRVGVIEVVEEGQANIRPIDGQDPASLLSRGVAYTVLVGIGGKGTTAARPVPPVNSVSIYFDTTLAAAGKPIFWTGTGWVDATGTAV